MPEILRSYASSQKLPLGKVIEACETRVLRRVAGAVALDFGEGRQLHAFDFGGIVLVGVPPDDVKPALLLLEAGGQKPEIDTFLLEDGPVIKVTFDAVTLPDRNPDLLRVVARVIAQSGALEQLEHEVEALLHQIQDVVGDLAKTGRIRQDEVELTRFVGRVLQTRANLVSELALLDKPEETWEDQRASDLHVAMVRTFEIKERVEALDEKLGLIQDSIEVITDVWRSRHSTQLERIVIALICIEIGLTLAEWGWTWLVG